MDGITFLSILSQYNVYAETLVSGLLGEILVRGLLAACDHSCSVLCYDRYEVHKNQMQSQLLGFAS